MSEIQEQIKWLQRYKLKATKTKWERVKITGSISAKDYIMQFYGDDIDIYESVFILLLNNSNETTGYAKISQGGITGSVIDARIVAKYCIDSLCTGMIMAHNHPSGKLQPSDADKDITNKIKKVMKIINVKMLDHIILTSGGGYYSFQDENLL